MLDVKPKYKIFYGDSEAVSEFLDRLNTFISEPDVHLLEKPGVVVHFHVETRLWHFMATVVYSDKLLPKSPIAQASGLIGRPRLVGVN